MSSETAREVPKEGAECIGQASLVLASVMQLWLDPSPLTHAEACRRVSQLHKRLHDPETFKAVGQL